MFMAKLYASVIDDVIGGVREFFMDEGVDEQVLMELRHSWELKLKTTKAVEVPKPEPEPQPPHLKNPPQQPKPAGVAANSQASSGAVNTTNHNNKTVSIQITLPGANVNEGRHITIDVPSSALSGNQLHTVLTGPIISATMALPSNLATTLLQQHVNAALQGHTSSIPLQAAQTLQAVQAVQNSVANGTSDGSQRQTFTQQGGVPQVDGVRDSSDEDDIDDDPGWTVQIAVQESSGGVPQVDGVRDSSDEDDNDDDDNDDDEDNEDDDKDEDEDPDATDQNAVEEASEPLNSGDDVSEDDPTDMFETDNVVVCQYDKITRSRNKWKFYLKDGIMNLGGKDFVFQRSSGDAEW